MLNDIWTPSENNAWRWPESLRPSQWAERFRILSSDVTAEPGPWHNERTPYLVAIMDAFTDPEVEGIVVLKAAQVGFSELMRNLMGFCIDHDPGPALCVMPDQKSAEELVNERLKPLMEHTPAVARHVTSRAWDIKKSAIRFDTMSLYMAWAGSSQGMKSRPIRYLFLDEVDEYPPMTGNAGDPIAKALKRITTYAARRRARVVLGSTPTTRIGNSWRWWERCGDRREYWVPCPHCGGFQRLIMGERGDGPGLKWPAHEGEENNKHSARVAAENSAYYQCEWGCRITDRDKPWMLVRGKWAGEDQVVQRDGRVTGPANHAKWIGYKVTALYSPWVSFSQMAAEFIQAQNSREELEDFLNQRLAEPFEEVAVKNDQTFLSAKRDISAPFGTIPEWTQSLLATADTQKDWFAYSIRAWGFGNQSALVWYGTANSFDELQAATIDRTFTIGNGSQIRPSHLLIDTGGTRTETGGSRTNEVYEFCLRDPGRILATKGASSTMRKPWNLSRLSNGVNLYMFDTNYFKDMLNRLMSDPDHGRWLPASDCTDQYLQEMVNEQKIRDRNTNAMRWIPISHGRRLEAWDCEVLQCLAADMAQLGIIPQAVDNNQQVQSRATQPASRVTSYREMY